MRWIVVAEPADGAGAARGTLEALGAARAAGAEEIVVVRPGSEGADYGAFGATGVVALEPALDADQPEAAAAALAEVLPGTEAEAVVWAAGPWGREVGTRVAARLGAGFVADGQTLSLADDGVRVTKAIYGGKAVATLRPKGRPAMAQLRLGAVDGAEPGAGGGAPTEVRSHGARPAGRSVVSRDQAPAGEGPSLTEAKRVVSGGRGLGGPENFRYLEDLAGVLGAAVGASRAAVDAGWVPASYQVGQTGVSVAPDLYLAVGISGASQHVAGITRAKHIVAINKDAEAPIFQLAEFGVVGDYREVLPALTEALRGRTSPP